jgi:molybdopterin/thiamine biosynthesis adenylyltransferase
MASATNCAALCRRAASRRNCWSTRRAFRPFSVLLPRPAPFENIVPGEPSKAIDLLQAASPYELGYLSANSIGFGGSLCPIYIRGEAYLKARRGFEAAAEFQKILDHLGIVFADPIGALAHLQLGRAFVLAGDPAKARIAYRCLYPEPPPPGLVPSCAEGGVLGILPGTIGLIQATETVKLILGIGQPLVAGCCSMMRSA